MVTTLDRRRSETPPAAPCPSRNRGRTAGLFVLLALGVFAVYSLVSLDFSWASMMSSLDNARDVFALMDPISLPPLGDLAYLIGLTLGIVVLGTVVAALISVPVAWVAASNTTPARGLLWIGRAIGVVTRAVPDVVLALAFSLTFVLGSPLPGVLAIGIHSIGMISKLFADAIEQIDDGPRLAIRAVGGSRAQEFWSGVFPQVMPSWIATTLHRFDINLRGSAILGYAGVGGLGYAMKIAFENFPQGYGRGLGIAGVIFVLCVVVEVISSTIRRNLLGVHPTGRGLGDTIVRRATRDRVPRTRVASPATVSAVTVETMARRPWSPRRVRNAAWTAGALALIVGSYWLADIEFGDVTWGYVWPTIQGFWPPDTGTHSLIDFGEALLVTVQVAFGAALLSLVFSLIFGSFAARNIAPNGVVRSIFRVILVVFRGIPELVLAIFLIMVTGLGNQAGAVALAIGGIGLLGKLIADSCEEVDAGPERALTAVGASPGQRYLSATWPQAVPSLIGNTLYLVDTNIRAATLLGIVGGSGIGFYLTNASTMATMHGQVTFLVIMLIVTVLAVEGLSVWLRRVFK
ncbi:ABC transporter permease subunit [Gordonia sp. HY442]|uniref:PhnE/PtxC family ABC transporter permease n=1 Tax=Gordonia zhenghanii TaxID=2911516 RepID=UPI001EFF6258|nr:ABC transporter permease subunit [Gordonia zhenghanii]MCF8607221.1 ABC transporter permease subunit [Gordonia zhenghanii]